MTTLVVGANGATGQLLVGQILERGERVRIIARSKKAIPKEIANHKNLSIIQASVLDLTDEYAADYLRTQIGQDDGAIERAVVRPDTLIDEAETTEFTVHPSPIRSAIFDAGVTSQINVGCFMADLICSDDSWGKWKGKMPVIYNRDG